MPFIAKVLFLAACLSFAVVFSMEETGNFDSLDSGNRQQKKKMIRRQRLLVQSSVEQCKDNIVQASSKYGFLFSKEAFLDFINLQSGGSIVTNAFDTSAIGLVHEFWIVTCTVKQGDCTNDEPVTVYDLLNYQGQEGQSLIADFCSRVDDKLTELITPVPTQNPSNAPSKLPTALPTASPSVGPTMQPSWHPSSRPTRNPSASPASSPSSIPSTRPSPTPTLSKGPTFHPTTSPTLSSRPTARPTASPTRLHKPSDYPSMHPTASPTNMESFTLTFSVGYNVSNAEELMIQWTKGVAYQVLETFDPNCTGDPNTALECPLTLSVTVFLNVRPCSSFGTSLEANTCALADLTISLSSNDEFDVSILTAINQSVRERINELADIL